jgi:hypothetical protein
MSALGASTTDPLSALCSILACAGSASVAVTCAVYDVTRADSFENLERIWMKEVDIYSNIEDAVKMVVANKVDLVSSDSLVLHFGVWRWTLWGKYREREYSTPQYSLAWPAGRLPLAFQDNRRPLVP